MSEELHQPELKAVEAKLTALTPRGDIDRDLVLFRAGQASVRPTVGWRWPCASGVLGVACAALAAVVVLRPVPPPVVYTAPAPPLSPQRATDTDEPPAPPMVETPQNSPSPAAEDDVAQAGPTDPWPAATGPRALEQQVLRWGLDAIPPPRATASAQPPLSVEGLLGLPPKPAKRSGSLFPSNLLLHGDRS